MADQSNISFELDRFEWINGSRLELAGVWHGVSKKLARAVLVIEVDGRRYRLRALPEDTGTPEQWKAAFRWKGDDIPRLNDAELEVGRGIVVDLPRPRSSKARAALPKEPPIPATTRDEKADEALTAARNDAEQAREAVKALRAERDELKAERDALRRERDELGSAAAGIDALRARAEEAEALRADAEEAKVLRARAAEADELRTRAEDAEAELIGLTARAEAAEEALAAAGEKRAAEAGPDIARLRAELESVERERNGLRAQLDSATERLQETQAMPPPTLHDGDGPPERRRDRPRRPAERTAKRKETKEPEPSASVADKVTDWVAAVIGARDEEPDEGANNGESHAARRSRATTATAEAPRRAAAQPLASRRRRPVPARGAAATATHQRRDEAPSWPLRVAAIGLLALLMIALLILLSSIL